MALRQLLTRLLFRSIDTERLVHQLSESSPIQRAARLTLMLFQRGKTAIEDLKESPLVKDIKEDAYRAERIRKSMVREVKTDLKDLKDIIKLKPFKGYKK